ncbi:MAG: signal recognition particle receptor subunit alpha, partial [Gammaproteobacteria bacterium]
MFDNLSERLRTTLRRVRGQGRLTEENVRDALRDVRMALLEADVALPVVREFIERVRVRAVGREVSASVTPGQALVKVVHDELIAVMGAANEELDLNVRAPAVVLMAGLQGSGKTTSTAKLAR